jgi:DegV family protein with EDD domain
LDAVVAEAESTVARIHSYIVVHRLESLRRSGRIGTASSWLGTALSLKPLLRIDEAGRLVLVQRIRTSSKATAAMIEHVLDVVGEGRAALAVQHIGNPAGAADVAATLAAALPGCGPVRITELGPVLGIHVGTGAVAVVAQLRIDDHRDATILPFKR